MASILDLLKTEIGEKVIAKASEKTNESKDKVSSVLGMAMPLLLGALKNNSKDEEGAKKIAGALDSEKHNGELLKNIDQADPEEMTSEGNKILDHILGGKQSGIIKTISSTLNVSESSVNSILKMAAPVIMSLLGSQKRKDKVGASGITGLISSVLGSSSSHDSSLIDSLLEHGGDGKIIGDIAGKFLGGGKKGKEGGSILGGYTGGK